MKKSYLKHLCMVVFLLSSISLYAQKDTTRFNLNKINKINIIDGSNSALDRYLEEQYGEPYIPQTAATMDGIPSDYAAGTPLMEASKYNKGVSVLHYDNPFQSYSDIVAENSNNEVIIVIICISVLFVVLLTFGIMYGRNKKETNSNSKSVQEQSCFYCSIMDRVLYNQQAIDKYECKIWLTPEEAIELYTARIELKPNDYKQHQSRANAKFKLNDFVGALEDFDIALNLNGTEHEGILMQRGISLSRLEQHKEALAILTSIDEVLAYAMGYFEIEDFYKEVRFIKEQIKGSTNKN